MVRSEDDAACLVHGAGIRGGHLWIFFEPIPAKVARRLILGALPDLEGVEVFPKRDHLDAGSRVGNLMRGPLGFHWLTGRRYPFVDAVSLKPVSTSMPGNLAYLETMERITPLKAAEVLATLLDEARPQSAPAIAETHAMAPTKLPKLEQSLIERIKGNIGDLYAFISRYVELDEHGRGHCPFHPPNRHPSFAVNRQRDPFTELIPALEEAQRSSGFGYFPSVQGILESRIGSRLRDLGYFRPSVFFQKAERRGLVRITRLGNGALIILKPNEEIPSESEMTERQSILLKLGDEWTREALRIIAAAEDQVGGVAQQASLVRQLQHTLPAQGGPALRTAEVNRLLKREFVQAGYVEAFVACVKHHTTGEPVEIEAYRLRRDHPAVIQALLAGPTSLTPEIPVRPLHFAYEARYTETWVRRSTPPS